MQTGAAKVSVAVLAGGKSSRMGTDKAFVSVRGKPMIRWVLEALDGLGAETFLVTNRPESYSSLGLPMVRDAFQDCGSLGGLYTAIARATYPHVLTVACDMPFLCRDLLAYMISVSSDYDVVVPRLGGIPEPLHAVYGKACLEPIRPRLIQGRLKIIGFYGEVRVRYMDESELDPYDPEHHSFRNLNTPQEVSEA